MNSQERPQQNIEAPKQMQDIVATLLRGPHATEAFSRFAGHAEKLRQQFPNHYMDYAMYHLLGGSGEMTEHPFTKKYFDDEEYSVEKFLRDLAEEFVIEIPTAE